MSDPAVAVARGMAVFRGNRSGVVVGERGSIPVDDKTGMEDVNEFWAAAKSPPAEAPKKKEKPKALKPRNKVVKPKKRVKPRFSLSNNGEQVDNAPPKKLSKYLAKVAASDDGDMPKWSPSDLSLVTTAPPTPAIADNSNKESPPAVVTQGDDKPVSPPEAVRASPEEAHEQSIDSPQADNDHQEDHVGIEDTLNDNQDDGLLDEVGNLSDNDDLMPPPPPEEDPVEEVGHVAQMPAGVDSPGNVDFPNELDDGHDDDDDKEGDGFTMVHDPETPDSSREERLEREREELKRKAESKKKKSKKTTPEPKNTKKSSRSKKTEVTFSPTGYPAGNRDYEIVPVSDFKASPQEGVRRSKRARFRPLAHWKNEKLVLGPQEEEGELGEAMGNMPAVTGVQKALPTPYKKRKMPNKGKQTNKRARASPGSHSEAHGDTPFDDRRLRKKYNYADDDLAHVWDENIDDSSDMDVIARVANMKTHKLPLPNNRPKRDGKVVGEAAHAFNVEGAEEFPGYITGRLVLPPKGIKDSEATGMCSMIFVIYHCQPNALEVAYADPGDDEGTLDPDTAQRFLLEPGDMFRVPPGNTYRIQNHSTTTDCHIAWTIIKNVAGP